MENSINKIKPFPFWSTVKDRTGLKFSRLSVLGYVGHKKGRPYFLCRCECGNFTTVLGIHLKPYGTQSCGCAKIGVNLKHGETRLHRESRNGRQIGTKEWRAWQGMISRCYQPRNSKYQWYGARGITVCDRWRHDFRDFLSDLGRAPSKTHSLDRINVLGNYEPGNVCWASSKWQANNRRRSRHREDNLFSGTLGFGA